MSINAPAAPKATPMDLLRVIRSPTNAPLSTRMGVDTMMMLA
jgi:hypothetical protein